VFFRSVTARDTLLPLTIGSYLAVQFSSFWGVPAVIHIARKVPEAVGHKSEPECRQWKVKPSAKISFDDVCLTYRNNISA